MLAAVTSLIPWTASTLLKATCGVNTTFGRAKSR
jgi:hypothetical protein